MNAVGRRDGGPLLAAKRARAEGRRGKEGKGKGMEGKGTEHTPGPAGPPPASARASIQGDNDG